MEKNMSLKKLFGRKMCYRYIAAAMLLILAFMVPATPLREYDVKAAKRNVLYIKEVKLFIKEDGTQSDAQSWCDSQAENKDEDKTNDWIVAEGNLNEGAEGALKSAVGVFFCFQTTDDPKDAIRDMAVMNELGNYSEGAYELLIKEQQEVYADMINDMKDMLEEYRKNYKDKLPTAVKAHDFMNTYIEDDSGKLLGDLLIEISDADLAKVLLQANGQVVLMIQEQLAFACDTGNQTWLDRMESIGSYKNLKKKFVDAYKGNTNKALKAMDKAFHDKALIIEENWDDINQHFKNMKQYNEAHKIDEMSDAEFDEFNNKQIQDEENGVSPVTDYVAMQENLMLSSLCVYQYNGGTLFDFFEQDKSEIGGDNLKYLYPLAASLSDGQLAAVNETVSLYSILMDALSATVMNDYSEGKAAKMDSLDSEEKAEIEEDLSDSEEDFSEWVDIDPISIYDGVDRGLYSGGVAVTSLAESYSEGDGSNWADSFVESGTLTYASIGLGAGSVVCAGAAISFAAAARHFFGELVDQGQDFFVHSIVARKALASKTVASRIKCTAYHNLMNYKKFVLHEAGEVGASQRLINEEMQVMKSARDECFKKGMDLNKGGMALKYKLMQGLKIGFAVLCILLAVADIVMTSIALYEYYNREHIPVPKYIVNLSYNEDKEASYVAYKQVTDQNGGEGDLNGGGGKQWLALFVTKDEDAGDPIMAPVGETHMIQVLKGSGGATVPSGYSPLHTFGHESTPQNLTYADGEKGYSFNDKAGGTYLYFERDPDAFSYVESDNEEEQEQEEEQVQEKEAGESGETAENGENAGAGGEATAITSGNTALTGGLCAVGGIVIGLFGGILIQKKRKKSDAA